MEQRIPADFGENPNTRLDTPKTAGIQPFDNSKMKID